MVTADNIHMTTNTETDLGANLGAFKQGPKAAYARLKDKILTPQDAISSPATVTRHLKLDDLKEWYDDEELQDLLPPKNRTLNGNLSDLRYEDAFNIFLKECADNDERRVWTKAEDDFIRRNYKHLSDNTIALALNVPNKYVMERRVVLKLPKGQRTSEYEIPLIVWADRSDFELDCARYRLTKERGL